MKVEILISKTHIFIVKILLTAIKGLIIFVIKAQTSDKNFFIIVALLGSSPPSYRSSYPEPS